MNLNMMTQIRWDHDTADQYDIDNSVDDKQDYKDESDKGADDKHDSKDNFDSGDKCDA